MTSEEHENDNTTTPRDAEALGSAAHSHTSQGSGSGSPLSTDDRTTSFDGRVLADRFEVRERIGIGETGSVFLAFDRNQDRETAVKILDPGLSGDECAPDSLAHEVQLACGLNHPAIVDVYDVHTDGDVRFISTERVESSSLRTQMDDHSSTGRRFPIEEVLHTGEVLCDALAYAHRTTLHGGIKPRSVLFCENGTIKLTGFGLSRLRQSARSTTAGASIRTVPYMAPEQLKGSPNIDHRADQYAVAAVLYEMLTGVAPVGRIKPASEQRSGAPRTLSDALDRALEPDPADRFPDMSAFSASMTGHSVPRSGGVTLLGAVLVIALVVVAGVTYPRWRGGMINSTMQNSQRTTEARAEADVARSRALTAESVWREIVGRVSDLDGSNRIAQAKEAMVRGGRQYEAQAYEDAATSYLLASDLYESLTAAARPELAAEPSKIADAARDLLREFNSVEQELYARETGASQRMDTCDANFRNALTDDERRITGVRKEMAEAELELAGHLKQLAVKHVFDTSSRADLRDKLDRADRQLEQGLHKEALPAYAELMAQLEQRLAWVDEAAAVLRMQQIVSCEMERLLEATGPIALDLPGVRSATEEAAGQLAQIDHELDSGGTATASAMIDSAHEQLSDARARAIDGLLSQAQEAHGEGHPTATVLALDELLALDPNHDKGHDLRRQVLFNRITDSVGIELIFIPPGEFVMGSPTGELGRDEDERQRQVRLTSGFYMSATEVTQSQWSAVMGDNPSHWTGDVLPVEQVSWEDALEFCRRLSDREGRLYRLPTEAEWEYACRAGTTTPFSFGDAITTDQANFDGEIANGDKRDNGNTGDGGVDDTSTGVFRNLTVPVAGFPPNAWGLYDMHGNVWEWCPDGYEDYPKSPVIRTAEKAPIEGRVLRGGSWRSRSRYLRCANRVRDLDGSRLNNIGLRVVAESD